MNCQICNDTENVRAKEFRSIPIGLYVCAWCHVRGILPYRILVAFIAANYGYDFVLNLLDEELRNVIWVTLKHYGVPMIQFRSDVADEVNSLSEEFFPTEET